MAKKKNKGGAPLKFTEKDIPRICEAIKGSRGIKSAIYEKLGCGLPTFNGVLERFPTVRKAYEAEKERFTDVVESNFFKLLEGGEDASYMKWYLSKKGKSRGYGDEQTAGEMEVNVIADIVKGELSAKVASRRARAEIGGDFAESGEVSQED